VLRRFGFIYNARAGHGRQASIVHAAADKLRANGDEAREYDCPSDPAGPVADALREDCHVIVACGGDGTVSGVASAMRSSGAVLAVLPLGTLNHFAKDIGIFTIGEAEKALLGGHIRVIDLGMVNGRPFVNNSGIGIYPAMVALRERVRKRGIPKWVAFVFACARGLARLPFLRLRLEADYQPLNSITTFLFVGNNVYEIEGWAAGTRKRLDEGALGVCTARHQGPLGLVRMAFRALNGRLRQDRDFTVLTARKLTVRVKHKGRLKVSLDGEVRHLKLPLEYSIAPAALRVLAP
jgi:diacylglycerol kinase family enzyme